jgi:hypothetical protein
VTFDSEVSEQTSHDMDTDEDTSIPTIEISAVNDCLQILGESPLRPVSKATLHYAKQKIKKSPTNFEEKDSRYITGRQRDGKIFKKSLVY